VIRAKTGRTIVPPLNGSPKKVEKTFGFEYGGRGKSSKYSRSAGRRIEIPLKTTLFSGKTQKELVKTNARKGRRIEQYMARSEENKIMAPRKYNARGRFMTSLSSNAQTRRIKG